jgi:hypothetical protein
VAEHRLAVVALKVLGIDQDRRGTLDVLPEQMNARFVRGAVLSLMELITLGSYGCSCGRFLLELFCGR